MLPRCLVTGFVAAGTAAVPLVVDIPLASARPEPPTAEVLFVPPVLAVLPELPVPTLELAPVPVLVPVDEGFDAH